MEKVLQGDISDVVGPYMKDDTVSKGHRLMRGVASAFWRDCKINYKKNNLWSQKLRFFFIFLFFFKHFSYRLMSVFVH